MAIDVEHCYFRKAPNETLGCIQKVADVRDRTTDRSYPNRRALPYVLMVDLCCRYAKTPPQTLDYGFYAGAFFFQRMDINDEKFDVKRPDMERFTSALWFR